MCEFRDKTKLTLRIYNYESLEKKTLECTNCFEI